MSGDEIEHLNERAFPSHRLPRDIGLAEYSSAVERLSNCEKALAWATNTALIIGTVIVYLAANFQSLAPALERRDIRGIDFSAFLIAAVFVFLYFATRYLAELQKSLVFAERKIIVIRRMLGASYGDASLVLPNQRIEGANDPFSIPMFSGFFSISAFPLHLIASISAAAIIFLSDEAITIFIGQDDQLSNFKGAISLSIGAFAYLTSAFVYRRALFEANERLVLVLAKILGTILRVRLVANFERELYQLRLEIAEMHRIGTPLEYPERFAIFIEDRRFYSHSGVDLLGILRALKGLAFGVPRGGGSTITQQLARSMFIIRPRNTFRRKLLEIMLAKWLERVLSKKEILHGYLATARFDSNLYGIHRAYRDFFNEPPEKISEAEAFLLIERLGNIRGRFLGRRVQDLLVQALDQRLLAQDQALRALDLYEFLLTYRIS